MRSRRLSWFAIGATSVAVVLTAGAGVASAAAYISPNQTASQLRSSHVVVADDAEARGQVNVAQLQKDLGSAAHLYVAVLPARALAGTAEQTAANLGSAIGDDSAVVVVAVGGQLSAAQGPRAPLPPLDARRIAATHNGSSDLQGALDDTLTQIRRDGSATSTTTTTSGANTTSSGSSSSLLAILLVVVLAVGGFLVVRRRRAARETTQLSAGVRADVESMYSRLGSDVSTLNVGTDKVAQQAMVDASERYNATGSMLADPHASAAVLAQARCTAIEGIMATRVARERLGLDPGPDPMPIPPTNAPQVDGRQDVQVDGVSHTGYGQYRPGAANYFGGGTYQGRNIPGGWYPQPFWQTTAISAIAFGGLGYALGGGFGGDYEGGRGGFGGDYSYGGGYEGGRNDYGNGGGGGGGGDWGGGGGGDWGGGGGGDWGGGGD